MIPSNGVGGMFGSLAAIAGPAMMLIIALRQGGPVRKLLKAHADAPERARKAATLGITDPPLQPLIRAGVVVREEDGRVWVNRLRARKRQWRIGAIIGASVMLIAAVVALLLSL